MSKSGVSALWLVLAWLLGSGSALAQDLTTSFEFTDTSGEFVLGTSPTSVTFTGGEAKRIFVPSMYHSGMNSWMIDADKTGVVTFETPAAQLELFFRDQSGDVQSIFTAFDASGQVLATFFGTTGWTQVTHSGASPIARITVVNGAPAQGAGQNEYAAVDDFSFTAFESVPLADPIPARIPVGGVSISLQPIVSGLIAPNWGIDAGDGTSRLFVTDQPGTLYAIDLTTRTKKVFLDVSDRLVDLGIAGPGTFDERGLLGVAFHPQYASNGLLYSYTSEPVGGSADFTVDLPVGVEPNHQSVVTEWQVQNPVDPMSVVDPTSARVLLRIDEPQFNHDGGALAFGPDGLLHVSLGDGGNADDQGGGHSPGGNGQDTSNVLGSVLRIDVNGTSSANGQYGVPEDNPFVGEEGVDEIYAFGLRNPFRLSFDSLTGELYVADVGQNDIEEINLGLLGGNFGWPFKEGSFFFDDNDAGRGFVTDADPGVPVGLLDPIAEYDHDEGVAIVGGFVYRGTAIPELAGRYVFGDFQGRLFYLDEQDQVVEFELLDPIELDLAVLGFGQDADGEVYVMANATSVPFGDTGVVLKLVPEPAAHLLGIAALLALAAVARLRAAE